MIEFVSHRSVMWLSGLIRPWWYPVTNSGGRKLRRNIPADGRPASL